MKKLLAVFLLYSFSLGAVTLDSMTGTWVERCHFERGVGTVTELKVNSYGQGELNFQYYKNSDCTEAFFNGLSRMHFYLGSLQRELTEQYGFEVYNAEVVFEDFRYWIFSPRLAKNFRESRHCGINDWIPEREFDVTGLYCSGRQMPDRGLTFYTVMGFLDEDTALLGQRTAAGPGDSSDTRATHLSFNRIMTKHP